MKTSILCLLLIPILSFSQKASVGVGYMNFWTANAEFKINKEKDELRLFLHSDDRYPITKLSILYQPFIQPYVGQLRQIIAIGPSIGYWRNRKRSYYPANDAYYSPNSPWKKNPTIGLDGIAGLEYGTGAVSIEIAAHYWLCLNNNFFGSVRPLITAKINL